MTSNVRTHTSRRVRAAVPLMYAGVFKDGALMPNKAAQLVQGASAHAETSWQTHTMLGWPSSRRWSACTQAYHAPYLPSFLFLSFLLHAHHACSLSEQEAIL